VAGGEPLVHHNGEFVRLAVRARLSPHGTQESHPSLQGAD
jgi:hypothetical protein